VSEGESGSSKKLKIRGSKIEERVAMVYPAKIEPGPKESGVLSQKGIVFLLGDGEIREGKARQGNTGSSSREGRMKKSLGVYRGEKHNTRKIRQWSWVY